MKNGVPDGWTMMPLIDVATLQRGYDLPVQDRKTGHVPIFAANGPVGTHDVAKHAGPGVVTGRSGTIGKVHYVSGGYWPLNTSLFVKDFHGNHARFIFYLLKWLRLERFVESNFTATTIRAKCTFENNESARHTLKWLHCLARCATYHRQDAGFKRVWECWPAVNQFLEFRG